MNDGVTCRQCRADEVEAIKLLVRDVVLECYGSLLTDIQLDPDTAWQESWIAIRDGRVAGVVLTKGNWVKDLWIEKSARRAGIGNRLLALAEREIADRGQLLARLRLVSENIRALQFYISHGWREDRRYPHEMYGIEMVEMVKTISGDAALH